MEQTHCLQCCLVLCVFAWEIPPHETLNNDMLILSSCHENPTFFSKSIYFILRLHKLLLIDSLDTYIRVNLQSSDTKLQLLCFRAIVHYFSASFCSFVLLPRQHSFNCLIASWGELVINTFRQASGRGSDSNEYPSTARFCSWPAWTTAPRDHGLRLRVTSWRC